MSHLDGTNINNYCSKYIYVCISNLLTKSKVQRTKITNEWKSHIKLEIVKCKLLKVNQNKGLQYETRYSPLLTFKLKKFPLM